MKKEIIIDTINLHELPSLLKLAESVGWFFDPKRANMYVSSGTMYGHRAGNRFISSAALFQYGAVFSSLGTVIVHPEYQGQGLGKSLVQRCLHQAEQMNIPVSLVATSEGFPLYKSLGFCTFGYIYRFSLTNLARQQLDTCCSGLDELCATDLPDIIRLDKIAFGADRSYLYRQFFKQMDTGFIVKEQDKRIRGFVMAFQVGAVLHIGPLLAEHAEIALQLIQPFLFLSTQPVRIDVPDKQIYFIKQLQKFGFQETLLSPLMLKNADALPGKRDYMFAIADPALG
ncbi:MAG TPA: GNAT family N-acetyltransferase [Anoxybacillus sp.]|nr:GNAT family N-acetyltransferase [Anoxybacillus sp.]